MFSIEFSKQSGKFLKNLETNALSRIITRLEVLKQTPVPNNAKFIGRDNNEKVFRIRIGGYRALYKIKEVEKIILVIKIDKRSRVYN